MPGQQQQGDIRKETNLRIFIDARLVPDVLGSVGVAQRADGFIVVVVSRADVGNHHCLSVATK